MGAEERMTGGREEVHREVKMLTAKEVLQRDTRSIDVPEGSQFMLSPSDPDQASWFSRVQLRSYEDLQTLGFVPRRLAEDKVRQAIAADDAEVHGLASKLLAQPAGVCGCPKSGACTSASRPRPLRTVYNSVRKRHNPSLAKLLGEHYGASMAWDDPGAAIMRKWLDAARWHREIIVAVLRDITIQRNATFTVAPSAKSLMARNIWIHPTGRLVGQGSYLRIWANSISRFLHAGAIEAVREHAPVWSAAD